MLFPLATKWHIPGNFIAFYSMKPSKANIERWPLGHALQSSISNCLVLIPHRQLGSSGKSYGLTALHIHKTLNKSMFDTYH